MGDIDMSLDDIIQLKRGGTRGRRGFRGGRGRGYKYYVDDRVAIPENAYRRPIGLGRGRWQHDLFEDGEADGFGGRNRLDRIEGGRTSSVSSAANKILVSNLEFGVSDSDLKELFADFGPIRKLTVHYDRSGRSCGSAEITFHVADHAKNAIKQYNGILLDGRPMIIQSLPPGGFVRLREDDKRFQNLISCTNRPDGSLATSSYGSARPYQRGGFRARGRLTIGERSDNWRDQEKFTSSTYATRFDRNRRFDFGRFYNPSNRIKSRSSGVRRGIGAAINSGDFKSKLWMSKNSAVSSAELDDQLDMYNRKLGADEDRRYAIINTDTRPSSSNVDVIMSNPLKVLGQDTMQTAVTTADTNGIVQRIGGSVGDITIGTSTIVL